MGEKALVAGFITDSIELVKGLDRSGVKPSLVVWYFYEDADEWRLLIGGPELDKFLPKNEALAYQKISEAISSSDLQSLSISLVKVVTTNNALSKSIGILFGTPEDGIVQARFSDTTINGIFIKEMLILRSAAKKN